MKLGKLTYVVLLFVVGTFTLYQLAYRVNGPTDFDGQLMVAWADVSWGGMTIPDLQSASDQPIDLRFEPPTILASLPNNSMLMEADYTITDQSGPINNSYGNTSWSILALYGASNNQVGLNQ